MSAERDSCFGILPVEMKTKIFGYLNFGEKKKIRPVCPHWRIIIDDKLRFRAVLSNKTQEWVQDYPYNLESLTIQNLTKTLSISSFKISFPFAKNYVIGRGNSSQNILNFFRFLSGDIINLNIQNLALSKVTSMSLFRILPYIKWSSLATLSVTLGSQGITLRHAENYQNHIQSFVPMLKSVHVKTLKSLTLNLTYGKEGAIESKKIYFNKPWLEILAFIIKHGKSLQDLKLVMFGRPRPPPPVNYLDMLVSLKTLNLKNLSIDFDSIHSPFANSLCQHLGGEGEVLEQLEFRELHWAEYNSSTLPPTGNFCVGDTIRLHTKTLKHLCCHSIAFEMFWLRPFELLKILEVRTGKLISLVNTPSLPCLTKFKLYNSDGGDYLNNNYENNLPIALVECIMNRMPNVEELELILLHYGSEVTADHIQILQSLPKLRSILLGRNPRMEELKRFCERFSSLTIRSGTRAAIGNVTRRFATALIEIDRKDNLNNTHTHLGLGPTIFRSQTR